MRFTVIITELDGDLRAFPRTCPVTTTAARRCRCWGSRPPRSAAPRRSSRCRCGCPVGGGSCTAVARALTGPPAVSLTAQPGTRDTVRSLAVSDSERPSAGCRQEAIRNGVARLRVPKAAAVRDGWRCPGNCPGRSAGRSGAARSAGRG